jgi:hypothetical protein
MARMKRQPSKGAKKSRKSTQADNDASTSHKKAKQDKKATDDGQKKRYALSDVRDALTDRSIWGLWKSLIL